MTNRLARILKRVAGLLDRAARAVEAIARTFEPRLAATEPTLVFAGANLAGTLMMPGVTGPVDAVLILPGSGPVDRDGNTPGGRSDNLKLLAEALGQSGYATLRIDKRGIGASAAPDRREADLVFDAYVADAAAWIGRLRDEPRVRRVFALGHSEGALVAMLAARRAKIDGLVLVAGPGNPLGDVLRRQLRASLAPEALLLQAETIIAALERGTLVPDVPGELFSLFRPSVQPYVISLFRVDPVAALRGYDGPALVVQGTTDFQVTLDDANRLAAARPGVRLAVIEGMNHALKLAPQERAAQAAAYSDPRLPLAPELVACVVGFLRKAAA